MGIRYFIFNHRNFCKVKNSQNIVNIGDKLSQILAFYVKVLDVKFLDLVKRHSQTNHQTNKPFS